MADWYVVQLKPNCATQAQRNLARQGFAVFAPFQEVSIRSGQRFKLVSRPLFPGYFFVSFDPSSSPWRAINSTSGVARLVSLEQDAPTPVPRDLIEALMARCEPGGRWISAEVPKEGDRVRITAGPLAEFVATVDSVTPQRRVWVLLDILGASTRVAMNAEDLRLAG